MIKNSNSPTIKCLLVADCSTDSILYCCPGDISAEPC